MENASKALLIAGGVLIALIIMSLLVVAFTKIGDYQKAQSEGSRDSQLAEFNRDFERYTEDDIRGVDIVSLINKIHDYNEKQYKITSGGTTTDSTSVDYNIKMKLKVSGLKSFNKTYAYNGDSSDQQLFKNDDFIYDGKNVEGNSIKKRLDDFIISETQIDIPTLKKLSSIYNPDYDRKKNEDNIKEKLLEINKSTYANWNSNSIPTLDSIKMYRQYSEFKSDKFVPVGDPKYENGQIYYLEFKYKGS